MDGLTTPAPVRDSSGTSPQPSSPWDRLTATRGALVSWTLASLVGNILIIVTGAVVRLTASGLGCPTWPRCEDDSYVPRAALGHHGLIEFGNRLLTFVLIFLAIMVFVAAVRSGADHLTRTLAIAAGLGIPFQGVIGGITVLTKLNPWVVALHLLLSIALVVVLTKLWMHVSGRHPVEVPPVAHTVSLGAFIAMMAACWLGTVVTGSGPHSGDGGARRTGLDIEWVARLHASSVWVTVALTIAALVLLRRAGSTATRFAAVLLMVELLQGAIGYYQYFTGVPMMPVLLHMLGVGVAAAAAAGLLFSVKR